jgi:adenylate cyclase
LPFVAMSRGPDDEYFADGLTEEILNSLTRLPDLLVTARTSSFHFKGQDIPIPQIAASLGVAHVVEGSVRRNGNRLRVTAQLIRAADGFHLWSENYDRDDQDTFAVQTDIAEKIALALDVVMDDEQREQMKEAGVRNPEAFVAFQKGLELFELAHGSANMLEVLEAANVEFDLALQHEPEFSDAYLAGADYFTHFLMNAISDKEVTSDEREAALQAVVERHENAIRYASDESDRAIAAYDLAVITGQWRKLPTLYDELRAANGCVSAGWSLETSNPYGRSDEVLSDGLHETECNPMAFSGWVKAISAYIYLDKTDAAIELAHKGLETSPHIRIYQQLFYSYLAAGRFAEAEAVIDRNVHRDDQALALLVILAAARGDQKLAETQLGKLLQMRSGLVRPPLAQIAVVGDRDAANEMAARIDASPSGHLQLMVYPLICRCGAPFDLEATPNFAKLLDEAGFSWPPEAPINWPLKDW